MKIQYEEHQNEGENASRKWIVSLALDIAPLGKIYAHLRLANEQLSSSIWAENEFTNNLISHNLPDLQGRLERSGLNVLNINQHPIGMSDSTDSHSNRALVRTKI